MGKAKSASASAKQAPFRYAGVANPMRLSVTGLPYLGDFVVLSFDPQRSVAHLDKRAKKLAGQMRPKNYIAIPFDYGTGLPSKFKLTNEYYFSLVRQTSNTGTSAASSNQTSPNFLIPIAPYTAPSATDHPPLMAVAPFPFPNCDIDTAAGSLYARVTTTKRDRTPALPLPHKEMHRLRRIRRDHMLRLHERKDAEKASQRAIASPPAATQEVIPTSMSQSKSAQSTDNAAHVDDMKIMATLMSTLVDYSGDPEIPVVNVHYDLDVLDVVEDPQALKREEQEILAIIRDAKVRMARAGIQPHSPPSSLPWDDGIMGDLERVAQNSIMAMRKLSSSILSPARVVQRTMKGGWQSLKRLGAQDARARHPSSPAPTRPQSRSPSPPAVTIEPPQRAVSPTPTLVHSNKGTIAESSAMALLSLIPARSESGPATPAPALGELPPSPTEEESAVEDTLTFTPNAPPVDVFSSPDISPLIPGEHLPGPSRHIKRTGTSTSEDSDFRK